LKFQPYDANEKLRSKWTDSFAEFVIAKIILELSRVLKRTVFWKTRKEFAEKPRKHERTQLKISKINVQILVAPCLAVKCQKRMQVMSTSWFGQSSSDNNLKMDCTCICYLMTVGVGSPKFSNLLFFKAVLNNANKFREKNINVECSNCKRNIFEMTRLL
jgi:hypothetical protein